MFHGHLIPHPSHRGVQVSVAFSGGDYDQNQLSWSLNNKLTCEAVRTS